MQQNPREGYSLDTIAMVLFWMVRSMLNVRIGR